MYSSPNLASCLRIPRVECGTRCGTTIGLSAVAATVTLLPGMAGHLQFDRRAVIAGEWWRLITGHFVHWNADHLLWDLAVFAVVGAWCELWDRRRFLIVLSLATVLIPIAVAVMQPEFATYRGLSGLDSALFGLFAASFLRDLWQDRHWSGVLAIAGLLLGLMAKIAFELATGRTLFVDSAAAGFEPVPLAHLVGAVIGITSVARFGRSSREEAIQGGT